MACKNSCKLCPHFIAARSVTYASGVLTINIPAGTYNNNEKYCLVVADRIPTDAIIGAPVVVTIGSSTVTYPLLKCNGAQVVAGNLRSRYRYSTVFSTNVAGAGAFRLRGEHYKQNDGPNMRRIGFRIGGEMEPLPPELESEYQSYADYRRMNEGDYHRGKDAQMGRASGKSYGPMTYEMAKEWVDQMENEDGTKGPHWSLEQIKNIAAQKGLDCDPVHLWATMNMMYSDYCRTFKKFGVGDKLDFYIEMSKAFLDDKDAQPDKLTRYFKCIAE